MTAKKEPEGKSAPEAEVKEGHSVHHVAEKMEAAAPKHHSPAHHHEPANQRAPEPETPPEPPEMTGAELEAIREKCMEGANVFSERLGIPDEGTYWRYVSGRKPIPAHVAAAAHCMAQ